MKKFAYSSLIASFLALTVTVSTPALTAEADSCLASIQNGGFETPTLSSLVQDDIHSSVWNGPGVGTGYAMIKSLPGTNNSISQGLVWRSTEPGVELQNFNPFMGSQYAEIVGLDQTATLYQSVATTPGVTMEWSLAHRGYNDGGADTMRVLIGPSLDEISPQVATPDTGVGVAGQPTIISDSTVWRIWRGSYIVPEGQTTTVFAFNSISSYGEVNATVGNYLDSVTFTCAAIQPPGAAPTTAPTTAPAATLAKTGANLEWLLFAGSIVLIAGASFLTVSRRKRTA